MNRKWNKKGDLPVTILVIGVFAICTLALLSFIHSSHKLDKSFDALKLVEEANAKIESEGLNSFYIDKKENRFSPGFDENGKFSFFKEEVVFSVWYNP